MMRFYRVKSRYFTYFHGKSGNVKQRTNKIRYYTALLKYTKIVCLKFLCASENRGIL